ncbi:MAG: penicillin-binding protein, partial [Hyphomicrobiales bacterium]
SMNEILSQVPEWGTGRRAKLDDRVTAGKTGTTQSYRDAWFVGYTGNYVGAVWYGNDDYSPTKRLTGGRLPAMTWKEVMAFAHQGVDEKPIPFLNKDGSNEKQIVDIIAENENKTIEPLQETKALSSKSTDVLQGIGKLLKNKTKPLTTAFIPLKKTTGNGLKVIAGEF